MIFEFTPNENIRFMTAFAQSIGSKFKNGILTLPPQLGIGHIKAYDLSPMIRMMIHQYILNEDLAFKRIASANKKDVVTITFHHIFHQKTNSDSNSSKAFILPSVQVTSTDIDFETFFPAHTAINTIIIAIHVDLLKSFINGDKDNIFLSTIIEGKHAYLYEEIISPEMQEIAGRIINANTHEQLQNFYLKLMAEELIYFLLVELLKREKGPNQTLSTSDAKMMYLIKEKILSDIASPPKLNELVKFSGMSESKLKRLFKQIFGNSIYNYYQTYRMNEAAYMIREQKLSVSETGYRLGFTNLSHFSRLFEKHIGLKPKKFSFK
jgi:AraC-like DNA-binding protein